MSTKKQREQQEAIDHLREIIKPGDTVYTILRHVSRSGMYRAIDLYIMQDNQPVYISWWAAKLLEGWDKNHDACKAHGVGMDMGFHLVYDLSYMLYPEWECIGDSCPSNDHVNTREHYDMDDPYWKGYIHRGGYALRQRWM